jgi:DNA-binding LacI/PurR family transcriptional regulator
MASTKITSAEVAAKAGVSQSAVSRVFTPGASASAKTAKKVRDAADELGYRPNVLARAMVSGKSRIIGLVVAYLDNHFYPVALELLSNALQAQGYHILIFTAPNSSDGIDNLVQELMDYQVDGIVTASVSMSSTLANRSRMAGIPVVLFNRGQDGSGFSSVTSANIEGGRKVAEFLIEGGHQRIAHIAGWQGSSTGRDRAIGFRQGIEAAGQTLNAQIDGMFSRETAAEATRTLMKKSVRPDAIFVGNDHMAFAVMDVIRGEFGLNIPADVSIVGYDDVPMASWTAYDLTTVRQPVNKMVDATIETLIGQINDPKREAKKTEISGPLIARGSAKCPKGWTE